MCKETHEQYVNRINNIIKKSGESAGLDGQRNIKSGTQKTHEIAFLRQYGKVPK